MLDSRAVGSVVHSNPTAFTLFVRGDYEENLGMHSFYRIRRVFKSEHDAITYFKKTYPLGTIVPFDRLTHP